MSKKELSERSAADRKQMAKRLEQLIVECGATFTREEGGDYPGPRAIHLRVAAARGLQITVELDGGSVQPDVHVMPWHMHYESEAKLDGKTFGEVNPYHHRKATHVAYGFEGLCENLKRGLQLAASGEAFLPT
ncbi:hypothetical protein F6X40_27915 [Paraburkholderia sp. UCT31]|uniref:hypothetical protein n=1 Tax=Paraburkholderia sp. UCT31 TaxID=2615209 RepID=UPI0016551C24|nr:hypothetical protein [Paraburkholderia sp. UCT31]MBC8740467.1 hypothetical protein [Paraburkholderia sp. UCT31]